MNSTTIEQTVISSLQATGVPYPVIEIDPKYADTLEFCEQYDYRVEECGNTIIVRSKRGEKKFSACVVLGSDRLDVNRKVKALMQVSRLSFASADETRELTGMEIGGVTPFNLPTDIAIYVDAKVMQLDSVILGSGSRASKITVAPSVFEQLLNTEIIEGLSLSPEPD